MNMKGACALLALPVVSFWLYFLVASLDFQAIAQAADDENCETEIPKPDEDILTIKGHRIKIIKGVVYGCSNGNWAKGKSMISPGGKRFDIKKTGNSCEMIMLKTGKKVPLKSQFASGFEVPGFKQLFNSGWNVSTLQSPKVNSVKKYTELHRDLMMGGKFRDNRMDLNTKIVHSGKKSLRFYAVHPDETTGNVSKSLIEKKDLCFAKGDHIWFSAWYYLEKGTPATMVDFETRRLYGGPGIRLMIRKRQFVTMELKFADKPVFNQFEVPMPRNKWFNLKLHLVLSNHDDGLVEIWQDGKKILSTNGRTLPTHDTIYNAMQVGITATPRETSLYVDDVIVSNKPF